MTVRNDYLEFSIRITFDITKFVALMNRVPFSFSAAYKRRLFVQNFASSTYVMSSNHGHELT
jgi:hypothetical protein